jgi:hypothetical protein
MSRQRGEGTQISVVSPLEIFENGNEFLHESLQAGRHKFPVPVNYGMRGRQLSELPCLWILTFLWISKYVSEIGSVSIFR